MLHSQFPRASQTLLLDVSGSMHLHCPAQLCENVFFMKSGMNESAFGAPPLTGIYLHKILNLIEVKHLRLTKQMRLYSHLESPDLPVMSGEEAEIKEEEEEEEERRAHRKRS